ncbi:MAG: YbaK/EbsC family protein [Kangiellaceae bacterium]|nr:YbaK/EbsC family protein [Kangiellaceae bacterium]MCW8997562.1 YbaK/EbsC family protein [Kangiellaceae bacterium]
MTIATRVNKYLKTQGITFRKIAHPLSNSSISSAKAAKVSTSDVAKAVVLEDHEGHHLMAVLPTDKIVSLARLNRRFRADFHLLPESEVYRIFSDCHRGAIPPIGEAYHMNTVVDDEIFNRPRIFLEAGDHQLLLELKQKEVKKVFGNCHHQQISRRSDF